MSLSKTLPRRAVLRSGAALGLSLALAAPNVRAQTRIKLNIVTTAGGTNAVLGALMRQQGLFEQFGLDVTTTAVADGTKLMGGLLSGEMDMCPLSGFGQVFPAMEKGGKMKILAGGALLPLQSLMSVKPNVRTLKDLEGKTIGDIAQALNKDPDDVFFDIAVQDNLEVKYVVPRANTDRARIPEVLNDPRTLIGLSEIGRAHV